MEETSKLKVLYVASEIAPFLNTSALSNFAYEFSQRMQQRGVEMRVLVPRFGMINERKNRLYEVTRLSGAGIMVGEEEKMLVVKVASIPSVKMQVYFVDNKEYFQRRGLFHDEQGVFYQDNGERLIFFCKSVLETMRRLSWMPDIIHGNHWIAGLIPLYLKTIYQKDTIFRNAKCVMSVHGAADSTAFSFPPAIIEKIMTLTIKREMLAALKTLDHQGLLRLSAAYSDALAFMGREKTDAITEAIHPSSLEKRVEYIDGQTSVDECVEICYNLYNELVGVEV